MSMNLEQLILAYLKAQDHYTMTHFKQLVIHNVQNDEVSLTIWYGENYPCSEIMCLSHTEMLTWYIDTREDRK